MADRTVILPVCSSSAGGCESNPPTAECKAKAEVDTARKQVILSVSNPPKESNSGEITIRLPSAEYNPYDCMQAEDCLIIKRPVFSYHPVSGEPTQMADYPVIRVGEPRHCHWSATLVTAKFTPEDDNSFPISEIRHEPDTDCVIIASEDSYSGECDGYDHYSDISILDNSVLVPGMLVTAMHHFTSGGNEKTYVCGKKYYRTCSMTGGKVTEIIGTYDEPGILYKVMVEGQEIVAKSSDFVNYQVGDWVFLMSAGDQCPLDCDINNTYASPEENISANVSVAETSKLLGRINDYRKQNGRSVLKVNDKLKEAAERHTADMTSKMFLGHTGSDGSNVNKRIRDTGYGQGVPYDGDELLAKNEKTGASVFSGWKDSPGHNVKLLAPEWKEIAVSVKQDKNGSPYWCCVLAYEKEPGTADDEPEETLAPADADYIIVPFKIGNNGA